MPLLELLNLTENKLRILKADTFNADDYTNYDSRPCHLYLYLYDNPLKCNVELCWLKWAVDSSSITFVDSAPQCANLDYAAFQDT